MAFNTSFENSSGNAGRESSSSDTIARAGIGIATEVLCALPGLINEGP
jgi:hypothetical protein